MSACACNLKATELVAIDENVAQFVLQNELQEFVARASDCPTILVVVIDNQAVGDGCVPELPIVVGVASATILNAIHMIVIVNHLMKESRNHFLNGSGKGSCSDVDFMSASQLRNPSVFSQGKVAISLRGGLNGNCGP